MGAIAGLTVHDLPDDELTRYRAGIEAVTAADVLAVARDHVDLERAAIVLVGDVDAIGSDLETAGFGPVEVVRDDEAPAG